MCTPTLFETFVNQMYTAWALIDVISNQLQSLATVVDFGTSVSV